MARTSKEFEIGAKVKYIGPQALEGSHDFSSTIGTIVEKSYSSVFKYSYRVSFEQINGNKCLIDIPQIYLESL